MAEDVKKLDNPGKGSPGSYATYLSNFTELVHQFTADYTKQMQEDNPEELPQLDIFCGMLKDATRSRKKPFGNLPFVAEPAPIPGGPAGLS